MPLAGISVEWSVTTASVTLGNATGTTDSTGEAGTSVTLDAGTGAFVITAEAIRVAGTDTITDTVSFDVTGLVNSGPVLLTSVPIPENYGLHDTFVRDGVAFAFAWNTGVQIYDVGIGLAGGSPSNPKLLSQLGVSGGAVHNGWWFHNPNTGEKKYLFVGQEGPANLFTTSSGDIFVMDVSDLRNPVQVATYHMNGAGTHNFWVDEQNEILYAAYYNGGVVSLDISGTLSGDLSSRVIDIHEPNPGNSFVWGVLGANGSIYASDMINGLYQLSTNGGVMSNAAPVGAVPERYTSELWVTPTAAYTGTWGQRFFGGSSNTGNVLKIWALDASGAPTLSDSIVTQGITTVSDVEVTQNGKMLMFSGEFSGGGIYLYDLADPLNPVFISKSTPMSIHTASLAYIGGRVYAFGARNPTGAAMVVWDVTDEIP